MKILGNATGAEDAKDAESARPRQGALAFPKERRLRNKPHLKFVARQPCLICGRQPTHAHHVRFAQRRGLGQKVSDEFTVPLCSLHHDAVHRVGNERGWWVAQAIDPLKVAEQLWACSNGDEEVAGAQGPVPEAHSAVLAPRVPRVILSANRRVGDGFAQPGISPWSHRRDVRCEKTDAWREYGV